MTDYYVSIHNAIQFIEKNLRRPFTIEDVSNTAFQSRWHFQRIFRLVTGYSVYDYIKRRRLAEAGTDLLLSNSKIIDLALTYQYGSPEAFSRAFTKEFGISPSDFRSSDEHTIFEALDIEKEENRLEYSRGDIEYRPVVRNEIFIIGKKYRTSMQAKRNETDVPNAWKDFTDQNYLRGLASRKSKENYGVYYEWDYDENFSILLGCQITEESAAALKHDVAIEGLSIHNIQACKYMVFTIPGRENEEIIAGWNYIYGTWMPTTGYERDFSEDFDIFDDRFYSDKPVSEIYIPIR